MNRCYCHSSFQNFSKGCYYEYYISYGYDSDGSYWVIYDKYGDSKNSGYWFSSLENRFGKRFSERFGDYFSDIKELRRDKLARLSSVVLDK